MIFVHKAVHNISISGGNRKYCLFCDKKIVSKIQSFGIDIGEMLEAPK